MNVNPVISTVSSINAQGIPQTAAREAQTTMIIKDGETVVMAGSSRTKIRRPSLKSPSFQNCPSSRVV